MSYYGRGAARRTDWTAVKLMNHARGYAAKTLLRGPASDGSKLFPPTSGRQLPIPDWVFNAFEPPQVTPSPHTGAIKPSVETESSQ
jgi:hypothetical protein